MSRAPLNALHVFEAVARHGSFSRAAEELCVTQSAVSHQIRSLESWLGGALFERQGNRIALLPHAAELGVALAQGFEGIENACRLARRASGSPILTVAAIPSVAICWLIPRLSGFRTRAPDIDVRVLYALHGRQIDFRDLDLAIVFAEKAPAGPEIEAVRFLPGTSAPVCSRAFAEAHGPFATPEALAAAGLLHDTDESGWREWLAAAGSSIPVPAGPVYEDFNLLRVATLTGDGVALCPLSIIGDDLDSGHLVQIDDRTIRGEHAYYLVWKRTGGPAAEPCRRLREWLLGTAALHRPGPAGGPSS